ncbi:hypothetical protein [Duganella vulcania]|uniref:Uncharacterized protein n=1 Tax=Duganella vulcania TaxID=2692166 RepID=A0A845GCK6_9BURK|nr:hypothetical protein [Duganella vulcania]MYM92343.1 hypothetical protein [Duganella vulcania]
MIPKRRLSKQQRQLMARDTLRAVAAAIRTYFCGEGAIGRAFTFVGGAVRASMVWTARWLFVFSWAAIAGVLVGPEHDQVLTQLRAWMVELPLEDVLAQSHAFFMMAFWVAVKLGLLFGCGQRLRAIIRPAVAAVQASHQTALN